MGKHSAVPVFDCVSSMTAASHFRSSKPERSDIAQSQSQARCE